MFQIQHKTNDIISVLTALFILHMLNNFNDNPHC